MSEDTKGVRDRIKQKLFDNDLRDEEHDDDEDDDEIFLYGFDEIWKSEIIVVKDFSVYLVKIFNLSRNFTLKISHHI